MPLCVLSFPGTKTGNIIIDLSSTGPTVSVEQVKKRAEDVVKKNKQSWPEATPEHLRAQVFDAMEEFGNLLPGPINRIDIQL